MSASPQKRTNGQTISLSPLVAMDVRGAGCAKPSTELFGAKSFSGAVGGGARISEPVAQGPGSRPGITDTATDPVHRQASPALADPSGDRLTANVCQLVRRGPAVVPCDLSRFDRQLAWR